MPPCLICAYHHCLADDICNLPLKEQVLEASGCSLSSSHSSLCFFVGEWPAVA